MNNSTAVMERNVTCNEKNGADTRCNAVTGKKRSRKQAIEEYCKECSYDPEDKGTWRQQIEACVMTDCPLYEFRPVSRTNSPTLVSGVAKTDTPQDFPEEAMLGLGVHPPPFKNDVYIDVVPTQRSKD